MKPRYTEPITLTEARQFVKRHFGPDTRIPWGSKCLWIAGVRWVTDQPGCYLIAGSTGLEGVQITKPAVGQMEAVA
jgi:hypothetical protein